MRSPPQLCSSALDVQCRCLHQAVNTFGNRHVISIGIVRFNRCGIGRRYNNLPLCGLAYQVSPTSVTIGQFAEVGCMLHRNYTDGAALRLQAHGFSAAHLGNDIPPGPGRIDNCVGRENLRATRAVQTNFLLCSFKRC